jgi:hypothetical protein
MGIGELMAEYVVVASGSIDCGEKDWKGCDGAEVSTA